MISYQADRGGDLGSQGGHVPTQLEVIPQLQVRKLQYLLSNSGFFVPLVSHSRMSDAFVGRATPKAVVVGSGCVHTHGVSDGVPVDTVAYYAAAALVAKQSGLNKLVILIAPEIAHANANISMKEDATREKLFAIEEWHTAVAERVATLCEAQGITVRIVKDRDVMRTPAYQVAALERELAVARTEHTVCPYSKWQDLIFRTLQVEWGAGIKVGWTPHSDASLLVSNPEFFLSPSDQSIAFSKRLAFGEDGQVQGSCEVAFDTNTRAVWYNDPLQACYIPSAFTLQGKTVAPYTAKPVGKNNQHGRILLSAPYRTDLESTLHEVGLKTPEVLRGFLRQIATIDQAFPTLRLGLPGEETLDLDRLFGRRSLHRACVSAASLQDQKDKRSQSYRQERFTRTNAECASDHAKAIAPRLSKLIELFGIK